MQRRASELSSGLASLVAAAIIGANRRFTRNLAGSFACDLPSGRYFQPVLVGHVFSEPGITGSCGNPTGKENDQSEKRYQISRHARLTDDDAFHPRQDRYLREQ